MTITKEEAISIGTERFFENNKDLILAAIERGAANGAIALADSIGFMVSKKTELWLAKNTPDLIAAFKTKMAFDEVVENIKSRRRDGNSFDVTSEKSDA